MNVSVCIDFERIGEIEEVSISSCLCEIFGSSFDGASLDQKLVLLEVIAYSLREGGSFRENLLAVLRSGRPDMPEIYTSVGLQENEGQLLLGILYRAILNDWGVTTIGVNSVVEWWTLLTL